LGIGVIIAVLGLWSLYQNEVAAADGGFLQVMMAIRGNTRLERLVVEQGLVNPNEISKELKYLKIRFGQLVDNELTAAEAVKGRVGFGTVEETLALRRRK
jgi:hypothetical protein